MDFEELWRQVEGFPDTAMQFIPNALSEDTKKKLERYSPEEISEIVRSAVDEINGGSIETLDRLVLKLL